MSLSTITDFNEAGTSAADMAAQKIVQANSAILSADVNTLLEKALRRTRFLYNGGPYPTGITITQSTANGHGVTATGNGTGEGVTATGGASSGTGVSGTGGATNGIGVEGQGTGTGAGGGFIGGTSGPGVIAQGGTNQPGIKSSGNGTGVALDCLAGGVKFSGTDPVVNADPGASTSHGASVCKAWALITTDGAGAVTVLDGLNINTGSVAIAGGAMTVPFVRAFANTVYCVTLCSGNAPVSSEAVVYEWNRGSSTGGQMIITGRRVSVGAVANIDFTSTVNVVLVQVFGRH
jgi:hypothetical protein